MWDKNLWAGLNFALEKQTYKSASVYYDEPGVYSRFYLFRIEIGKPIHRFASAWKPWLSDKSDHYGKPRFLRSDNAQLEKWIPNGPWRGLDNKKWKVLSTVDLYEYSYSLIKRDGVDVVILMSKDGDGGRLYILAITPDGIARFEGADGCGLEVDDDGRVRVLR